MKYKGRLRHINTEFIVFDFSDYLFQLFHLFHPSFRVGVVWMIEEEAQCFLTGDI